MKVLGLIRERIRERMENIKASRGYPFTVTAAVRDLPEWGQLETGQFPRVVVRTPAATSGSSAGMFGRLSGGYQEIGGLFDVTLARLIASGTDAQAACDEMAAVIVKAAYEDEWWSGVASEGGTLLVGAPTYDYIRPDLDKPALRFVAVTVRMEVFARFSVLSL